MPVLGAFQDNEVLLQFDKMFHYIPVEKDVVKTVEGSKTTIKK
jgi:hypothetical protein